MEWCINEGDAHVPVSTAHVEVYQHRKLGVVQRARARARARGSGQSTIRTTAYGAIVARLRVKRGLWGCARVPPIWQLQDRVLARTSNSKFTSRMTSEFLGSFEFFPDLDCFLGHIRPFIQMREGGREVRSGASARM